MVYKVNQGKHHLVVLADIKTDKGNTSIEKCQEYYRAMINDVELNLPKILA